MTFDVERGMAPHDLAVGRDDIGGAVRSAHDRQIGVIGLDHLLAADGDGKFIATFLDREFLQSLDIVGADPDDGGAHTVEFRRGLGKLIRLDRAARGKCLGIEIEHDRPVFERFVESEAERLSGKCRLGGEIHRLCSGLERGHCRRCRDDRE